MKMKLFDDETGFGFRLYPDNEQEAKALKKWADEDWERVEAAREKIAQAYALRDSRMANKTNELEK